MKFMPMRTLSTEQRTVLTNLQRDGEVVITNNGQPTILMIDLSGRDLVDVVNHFRKWEDKRTLAQRQLEALDRFVNRIKAIDDEPLSDEDFSDLENNRTNFKREIDL